LRIVLCYPIEPKHYQQISAVAPGHEIVDAGQERIATELRTPTSSAATPKSLSLWPQIVKQGRLKWIQSSAAGLDHCLTPEVIESDIVVTSASGLFADQVAEANFGITVGCTRGLPTFFRQQQTKEFIRRPTLDLHGKTVGIVGSAAMDDASLRCSLPSASACWLQTIFRLRSRRMWNNSGRRTSFRNYWRKATS